MIQPTSYHENSTNVRSETSRMTLPARVSAPAPSAVLGAKSNGKLPRPLRWLRLGFRTVGTAAPGLMGCLAYWLWFRTMRFRARDWELQILERGEQLSFSFNGKSPHVWAWGEGPAVGHLRASGGHRKFG